MPEPMRVELVQHGSTTALLYPAQGAARQNLTLVLGHGAGANQASAFMVGIAQALAARGLDTWTFNFPHAEHQRRMPDRAAVLEGCFAAVVAAIRKQPRSDQPMVIGGKSLGGRIASQAAAAGAIDPAGLVFLGYPLHPPAHPEKLRAAHLARIGAPMLFVQGSRDPFGTPVELGPILAELAPSPRLYVVEGGDHSFKVPRGPVSQAEVHAAIQDEIVDWAGELIQRPVLKRSEK